MIPPDLKSPEDLIAFQWKVSKTLAESTEKSMIKDNGKLVKFSCATARILDNYISNHPSVEQMKKDVMKLQCEQDSVLILGESGTGKEMIARALHGSRWGKFIAINCTAMPDQLIESELFGHKKGSFTGAVEDKPGKFEAAAYGTIFLDEIGDMPLNMQTKLLRVLQEKVITPVGGNVEIDVSNCRVIAATNRTTEQLLNQEHFRLDLFYRLSTFIIKTLSLKERVDDIIDIVDSLGGEKLVEIMTKEAENLGNPYKQEFPRKFFNIEGNVRSLQAQVRRFQVLGTIR